MSPHERRQFTINFTWSWPAVIVLLFLAMLPIYGPLIPPLEGMIAPVTSKSHLHPADPCRGRHDRPDEL